MYRYVGYVVGLNKISTSFEGGADNCIIGEILMLHDYLQREYD